MGLDEHVRYKEEARISDIIYVRKPYFHYGDRIIHLNSQISCFFIHFNPSWASDIPTLWAAMLTSQHQTMKQ